MGSPAELPIRKHAREIADAVKANPIVVVIGETGSGKTTQISQILLEEGLGGGGLIGVTQPRRVAAVSVARRVAQERDVELGSEVGYAVRFEDRSSSRTQIKYLTDGTLLRELLEDPALSRYSVLVLDEAHERSLNTDILFGLLKRLAAAPRQHFSNRKTHGFSEENEKNEVGDRNEPPPLPPLKLVITSATLDSEKFAAYFGGCPVFSVPGRTFPVEIIHALEDHLTDYEAAAVDTAMEVHCNHPEGDILMFLTGQAEIDRAVKALNAAVRELPPGAAGDLMVMPLYAALPPDMQSRVFVPPPPGVRRCVVATNIAETSVTVDGVVYVIDPGVVKQKDYNPGSGLATLAVVRASRVQATQRAGRAGRTRPGTCFRLYTKRTFETEMPSVTAPEIQRTPLAGVVLYLKSLKGLEVDVLKFDFLDAPERSALEDALRQLYILDAIDADGGITPTGRAMAALPLEPMLARALLAAQDLGCLPEMLTVAAMLSPEGSVFLGNKGPEELAREPNDRDAERQRHQQQRRGGSGGRGGEVSERGRALLTEMMEDGLGDHVLLLRMFQAWTSAGGSNGWCQEVGVDARAMRFARDVRHQLENIMGRSATARDSARGSREERKNGSNVLRLLRKALTVGFATRLARRLPLHNGYRTLGEASTLAQVHPSCARLAADDDGLLPEWLIYHELVATARVLLSGVCPVEGAWVQAVLPKLQKVDVERLSGGASAAEAAAAQRRKEEEEKREGAGGAAAAERRNDDTAVEAARARFLARKKATAAAGGKRKR